MSKSRKNKSSKVPVIGEKEYAAYIESLRQAYAQSDVTLSGTERNNGEKDRR